ncbi:hypothetical protein MBLNU230_g8517t2 [Neophaeotheca triangularis]
MFSEWPEELFEYVMKKVTKMQRLREKLLKNPDVCSILKGLLPDQERAAAGRKPIVTGLLESQKHVLAEFEHLAFSARERRISAERNVRRDFRVGPSIFDQHHPLRSVSGRGTSGGSSSRETSNTAFSTSRFVISGNTPGTLGQQPNDQTSLSVRQQEKAPQRDPRAPPSPLKVRFACDDPLTAMTLEQYRANRTLGALGWDVLKISASKSNLYKAYFTLRLNDQAPLPRKQAICEGAVSLLKLGWQIGETEVDEDNAVTLELSWVGPPPEAPVAPCWEAEGNLKAVSKPSLQVTKIKPTTWSPPPPMSTGEDSADEDDDLEDEDLPSLEELQTHPSSVEEAPAPPATVHSPVAVTRKRSGTVVPGNHLSLSEPVAASDEPAENIAVPLTSSVRGEKAPVAYASAKESASGTTSAPISKIPRMAKSSKKVIPVGNSPGSRENRNPINSQIEAQSLAPPFKDPFRADLERNRFGAPTQRLQTCFSSQQEDEEDPQSPGDRSSQPETVGSEPIRSDVRGSRKASSEQVERRPRNILQPGDEEDFSRSTDVLKSKIEASGSPYELDEPQMAIDDASETATSGNTTSTKSPKLSCTTRFLLGSPTSSISTSASERKRRSLAFGLDGAVQG